jgi:outer membrane protein assembly factor BamA
MFRVRVRDGGWVAIAALTLLASRAASAKPEREFNIVPIAGGDSDVGIGGGQVSDIASLSELPPGFRWRLESAAFITFKLRDAGLVVPFQDYYLHLVIPNLGPGQRLRLDVRPSFTHESTLSYFGVGNASVRPALPSSSTEYERMHPTFSVEARYRVVSAFYALAGSGFTYNRLTVPPTTLLAMDQATGSPEVRAILGNFANHSVQLFTAELQWDTRDNEIVPTRGQFHTLRFRYSPHIGDALPYAYQRLTATTRFYFEPIDPWLTFAGRVVGDVLFGDPPFYELARFDETAAIGGGKAVRGVPAQRYYGKVKLFANLELRSMVLPFNIRSKRLVLGVAAFFDAGRSWTEISRAHPALDGTGLGLKYGVGGGLRLQQGRTFVVRLDVAWSPDAQPVGAYFAAGQIF